MAPLSSNLPLLALRAHGRLPRVRSGVVVLAAVGMLCGCSSGGGGPTDDLAGSPEESPPVVEAPADPIPPVRNPKKLTAIPPCLMLTAAQLETNRIDQPGQPKAVVGNVGCEWSDKARTREFAVFVDIGNDVLRNVYAQREAIPVLEVTEVAGLPAIRTKDDLNGTSCYFRIATAEAQTLIVRFTARQKSREDPCVPAKVFAEAIIANLPPLAG